MTVYVSFEVILISSTTSAATVRFRVLDDLTVWMMSFNLVMIDQNCDWLWMETGSKYGFIEATYLRQ